MLQMLILLLFHKISIVCNYLVVVVQIDSMQFKRLFGQNWMVTSARRMPSMAVRSASMRACSCSSALGSWISSVLSPASWLISNGSVRAALSSSEVTGTPPPTACCCSSWWCLPEHTSSTQTGIQGKPSHSLSHLMCEVADPKTQTVFSGRVTWSGVINCCNVPPTRRWAAQSGPK